MRFRLLVVALFLGKFCMAQSASYTFHADSTGKAEICVKGKFNGLLTVQSYRWNKWVTIDQFRLETKSHDTCLYRTVLLHGGENRMRLSIASFDTTLGMSLLPEIRVQNGPGIQKNSAGGHYSNNDTLQFPWFTGWEIYDQFGALVRKGQSGSIPLNDFQPGGYFLFYDNVTTEFLICNHEQH